MEYTDQEIINHLFTIAEDKLTTAIVLNTIRISEYKDDAHLDGRSFLILGLGDNTSAMIHTNESLSFVKQFNVRGIPLGLEGPTYTGFFIHNFYKESFKNFSEFEIIENETNTTTINKIERMSIRNPKVNKIVFDLLMMVKKLNKGKRK